MESSEKRAKEGYKKIDLGFNAEHRTTFAIQAHGKTAKAW